MHAKRHLPPPPAFFALAFAAGLALHAWMPFRLPRSPWLAALAWLLVTAAGLLALSAVWVLRRAATTIRPDRPTTALVTAGPFALTRNPMYLALGLLYVGLSLLFELAWTFLFLPAPMLVVHAAFIKPEERALALTFPEQYASYAASVRRWI